MGHKKDVGYPRLVLVAIALLLPTASLIPLGSLWLWEHGYVFYWAIATCIVVAVAYRLEKRLIAPVRPPLADEMPGTGNPDWTPRQEAAWDDVKQLAAGVEPERITSRDAALSLALEAIEVVARRIHPERRDPLLQFTVPEALAVVERASVNLRSFLADSFPLSERITVAQLMWLYRWRGALDLAEKGYDLWRVVRLLNPMAAATQELRERFTRQLYEIGRVHLAGRLARAFVREVGRAAIDLYGGNLRVTPEQLRTHTTAATRRDLALSVTRDTEPIRILVAGQTGAGKSSLVNALANDVEAAVDALPATARFTAYKLTHDGLPAAWIIDSPGLTEDGFDALIQAADTSDLVLWVCSAARAARAIDAGGLDAVRRHFAAERHRYRPPMILILTHIDALRPFNEWEPPYDLASATRAKSQSIRAAMEAASAELGFPADQIVPVRVDIAVAPYNVDAVWAKIIELMPETQRARLLRVLADIRSASAWGTLWSQAASTGRVIRGAFRSRSTTR